MSIFTKLFGLFGGGRASSSSLSMNTSRQINYDLVAIDIDGTLVRSDRTLTPQVIHAVRRATDAGVRVLLSTARPPVNAMEIQQQLGLETRMICYNGALICDGKNMDIVKHCAIDPRMALEITRLCRSITDSVQIRIDVLDKWYTDRAQPNTSNTANAPSRVDCLEHLMIEPVTRLMFLGKQEHMQEARLQIQDRFGEHVFQQSSDDRVVQLTRIGADKGVALKEVCSHYGVHRSRVMAIGDAPNDLPMLEWAGCAVAVANSYNEVLQQADHEVASNNRHGVAEAIHRYVLNEPVPFDLQPKTDKSARLVA